MTINSIYTGTITLYSSHADFPGPKTVPGSFEFEFSDDRTSLTITRFDPVEIKDIHTIVGTRSLVATLVNSSVGTLDPATGELAIAVDFEFALDLTTLFASQLALNVTTTQATMPDGQVEPGQPLQPGTGELRLVAAGTFDGGFLGDVLCGVILKGTLQPAPT